MRRLRPTGSVLATSLCLLAQDPPPPAAPPAAPTPAAPAAAAATPPAANAAIALLQSPFSAAMVEALPWRQLGPLNPMGRMTDLAVHPAAQSTWFVGTAGGGLWKTTNAGTTWQSLFDHQSTVSIGDVAIAPSDPNLIWVGTGEENARNSVQWGDGVYKSTDGGATFQPMGLRETFQIGHVEIHPTDPQVVYVAALGRLWGENDERGVYRTRDGGANWQRVLFVDGKTGCIDVRVHPTAPHVVFACLYERKRDGFDGNDPAVRFGAANGIYKSTDGGDTWKRLGVGLPSCTWGRSGLDLLASNPDTMVAIVETERSGWAKGDRKDRLPTDPPDTAAAAPGAAPEEGEQPQRAPRAGRGQAVLGVGQEGADGGDATPGAIVQQLTAGGPAEKAGLLVGDRITKVGDEAVKRYADLLEIVRDAQPEQKLLLTVARSVDGKPTESAIEVTLGRRDDAMAQAAGRPNGPYSGRLFGQDANKQTFQGELGFETGGVFRSDDRGETWRRLNSLTERPFYYSVIRFDPRDSQRIYCVGTSLWGSQDGGAKFEPIHRAIHVDFHGIWVDPDASDHLLAVCDGGVNETFDRGQSWQVHRGFTAAQYYDAVADNSVPYNVIGGLQDNGTWVVPSRTRYREGIGASDCFTIYGGDGFGAATDPAEPWIVFATSQNGALGMVDLRFGTSLRISRDRLPGGSQPRWNWDAPFLLSPHNRLTLYHAGSHVFRGERYTHQDHRQSRPGLGPVRDGLRMKAISGALGRTEAGTAVSLAESPRVQGLLYVGTDDGALWRTDDGGVQWQRLDANLPVVGPRYVSDLVPSHFVDDRIYLTLDGHRSDDFATYLFVSEDRGATWRDLGLDLPTRETCYAVMEDPRNENLLLLGTEFGCHVSLDRGDHWFPLGSGLPTVAVRDLFVQDRDSDLVAATHGRGVFVLDLEPLRQLTTTVARQPAHLFAVEPVIRWQLQSRGHQGHKQAHCSNPPFGAVFYLWLATAPKEAPVLTVHDVTGKELAKVEGKATAGLQRVVWDLRTGRTLAAPGTYAVRWQGRTDVEPRSFELRPDPQAATSGQPANSASRQESRQ